MGSAGAGNTAGNTAGGGAGGVAASAGTGGAEPPSAGEGGSSGELGLAGESGSGDGGSGEGGKPSAGSCDRDKAPEVNCLCHTYDEHDYWFCLIGRNFVDAEAQCVAKGMHLSQVSSAAEDGWIYATAKTLNHGEYYLGSSDASSQRNWSWLGGGPFWSGRDNGVAATSTYVNWAGGEPNDSGDCLLVINGLAWDDNNCADLRRYICEDGGSTVPQPYSCDSDSFENCACVEHDGRDYLYCSRDRSWEVSRAFCESMGRHQVRIDDSAENDWLIGLTGDKALWTAGKEVATGDWRWQDGTNDAYWLGNDGGTAQNAAFSDWSSGQPDSGGLECMALAAGSWDDLSCNDHRTLLCESNQ